MFKHLIRSFLLSGIILSSLFVAKAQDKVVDQIVAIVGSNPILKSDIEQQAIDAQAQGQTTEGDLKCEILEKLLEQKLLLAEAELDTNIVITDNQINQNMDRRMKYFIEKIDQSAEIRDGRDDQGTAEDRANAAENRQERDDNPIGSPNLFQAIAQG